MSSHTVGTRELRNATAALLRRVQEGEEVTITVRGEPVAALVPLRTEPRRRWISRDDLLEILLTSQADSGLTADLAALGDETTDDLGPIV